MFSLFCFAVVMDGAALSGKLGNTAMEQLERESPAKKKFKWLSCPYPTLMGRLTCRISVQLLLEIF